MRTTLLRQFVGLAIFQTGAWAQGVQNMDIFYMAGPVSAKSQLLPSSNVTVSSSTGHSLNFGYGYQVKRTSSGSLWLEAVPMAFVNRGKGAASIPGLTSFGMHTMTLGVRFMVPIQSRVSIYGILGGGIGSFRYPVIAGGSAPLLETNRTYHGVFALGGGVDLRLVQRISLRGEVRDFATGTRLSGVAGRHHVLPLIGVAFHF